jgi:hypothetical protein
VQTAGQVVPARFFKDYQTVDAVRGAGAADCARFSFGKNCIGWNANSASAAADGRRVRRAAWGRFLAGVRAATTSAFNRLLTLTPYRGVLTLPGIPLASTRQGPV